MEFFLVPAIVSAASLILSYCSNRVRHRILGGEIVGALAIVVAVLRPRPAVAPRELVVTATATDEDQCHQPDAQCERDDDPETHGDPAGRTDVPVADAGQRGGYHDTDDQNDRDGDRRRDRIAAEKSV